MPLAARLDASIHETAAELRRHMGVIGESLHSEIRALAEGIATQDERRARAEPEQKALVEHHRTELAHAMRSTSSAVRALESRTEPLESRVDGIDARLTPIEPPE